MQNFSNNPIKTSILTELPNGNLELGEAFAIIVNDMVTPIGKVNPEAQPFETVPPSWKKLASKPDKNEKDIKKLDEVLKQALYELAESYILYMAARVQNKTGKITYEEYEKFILHIRFDKGGILKQVPEFIPKAKEWIKNAFQKISAHGEEAGGDNLIDKDDMASFIYALINVPTRDENNNFVGFEVNGDITPEQYAINERLLFEAEDNMIALKMRFGYKFLTEGRS